MSGSVLWCAMTRTPSRSARRVLVRPGESAPPRRALGVAVSGVASMRPAWFALVVIAGLFAMHGLGLHGVHQPSGVAPGTGESAAVPSVVPHDVERTAGHSAQAAHQEPSGAGSWEGVASQTDAPTAPHEPSDGSALLGACLALLVIGALWSASRRPGHVAWRAPRGTWALGRPQLCVTARDLSPPLRSQLSIWRC